MSDNDPTPVPSSAKSSLGRHEACQQCRRKKTKCDAGHPCTPCVKAYRLERKRTAMSAEIPPIQCSYDEVLPRQDVPRVQKSKTQTLENRIKDLEALIQNLDPSSKQTASSTSTHASVSQTANERADLERWMTNLPEPKRVMTLVTMFFNNHPHPRRMFHRESFFRSLQLPLDHPEFPHPMILHAICAVVGMMTDDVPPPSRPNFAERPDDVLFPRNYQHRNNIGDSFCEQQARFCIAEIDRYEKDEVHFLDCLRAAVILTCHYHAYAKLYDTYLISGRAAQLSSLLGMNQYSTPCLQPEELSPADIIAGESRRNSFWLMYAQERLFSTGSAWPMCIDDEDVMQLLPMPLDYFNRAWSIPRKERQWSNSDDVLIHHPPNLTDPFVLYVKASLLVSEVKKFQSRQQSLVLRASTETGTQPFEDLRETEEFKEVDTLIDAFISNFPEYQVLAWTGDAAEVHLFLAVLAPHVAMILLQLPHADAKSPTCASSRRVLEAAAALLQLLRPAWESPARNLMMSATFAIYAFFMLGKVLLAFLEATESGQRYRRDYLQFNIESEADFVLHVLELIGERTPLAKRYAQVLRKQQASSNQATIE